MRCWIGFHQIKGIVTHLGFGQENRWKLGNPLSPLFMKRELFSFVNFGMPEESLPVVYSPLFYTTLNIFFPIHCYYFKFIQILFIEANIFCKKHSHQIVNLKDYIDDISLIIYYNILILFNSKLNEQFFY